MWTVPIPMTETSLLLQINATWSVETQKCYDALIAKRESEQITPIELQELIALTDEVEKRNVERLEALRALATIWNTTVPQLLVSLGLWLIRKFRESALLL